MVSLPEELQAREAAARRRVEELRAETAELAVRREKAREDLSRLEITWEAVVQVLAELSAAEAEPEGPAEDVPGLDEASVPHGVGVMMVPPWREGLAVALLPDVYRDIVEVIADAPGPLQAKQIVPRIGLATTTGKIEGTRGKLKRLVERGWLDEDAPGQFTLARRGRGERVPTRGDQGALLRRFGGANQTESPKSRRRAPDGTVRRLTRT
ncbi:hypothetical protein ABT255_46065 [Streptomyces mirabilis]|uniref:hypothetical protein n=1 Tax=Streptomyces mirabilis TaxID=68239 RepID=UPI003322F6D7